MTRAPGPRRKEANTEELSGYTPGHVRFAEVELPNVGLGFLKRLACICTMLRCDFEFFILGFQLSHFVVVVH